MSREEVIRQIVNREVQHLELAEQIVCEKASDLHQSACEHFGTWETALQYAGVNLRRLQPNIELAQDHVIHELRKLCILGFNLTGKANLQRNPELYQAAHQHFGSWENALQATGINLENAFPPYPRKHDKLKVLESLRERYDSGLSLTRIDVCLQDRKLFLGVKSIFGSWRRAMIAADIPIERFDKHLWSRQRVIECIQERYQQGRSIKYTAVRTESHSLACATLKHFGSWSNAIEAAGLKAK